MTGPLEVKRESAPFPSGPHPEDAAFGHDLQAMICSGKLAQVGLHTFGVYTALRTFSAAPIDRAGLNQTAIAKMLGVEPVTVKRAVQALRQAGLVETKRQGRSNVYSFPPA